MMTILALIIWTISIFVIGLFLLGVILGLLERHGHKDIADRIEEFLFKKRA